MIREFKNILKNQKTMNKLRKNSKTNKEIIKN